MPGRWLGRALSPMLAIIVAILVNLATSEWAWPVVVALIVFTVATVAWEVRIAQTSPTQPPIPRRSVAGALPAIWNVPARNAGFSGRGVLLDRLGIRLKGEGTAVVLALHGMSGIGKTQLVIEYLHRHADNYSIVWWIDAEQEGLIADQLAALGVAAGWVDSHLNVPAAVLEVSRRLRQSTRWVMVFDNTAGPAQLRDLIPAGPGQVIITSRNPSWAGSPATPIEVGVFGRDESVTMLRGQVDFLTAAQADALAAALGDLPLGLAQAAGFLSQTGMRAEEYLTELQAHATHVLRLGAPTSYPSSLAAAVWLSVGRLADTDAAAQQLVSICGFFGPDPVPMVLFTQAPAGLLPIELANVVKSPLHLGQLLALIGQFGLARIGTEGPVFHQLTQAVTRELLDGDQRAATRSLAERLLVAAGPATGHAAFWPRWKLLMPHILATRPATQENPSLRQLAIGASWYLFNRSDSGSAYDLAHSLYVGWQDRLGPDHPDTLTAAAYTAIADHSLDNSARARALAQRTLQHCRRALGEDHVGTLSTATELAIIMADQGDAQAARQLGEDTLARCQRTLGEDHRLTMIATSNLADHLRDLGEVERAYAMHRETLARKQQLLGPDHPQTLSTADGLAVDMRLRGDVEQAHQLHTDTVDRYRKTLGEDHPNTLHALSNLADDLRELGQVDQAYSLRRQTWIRCREILGENHPTTLHVARGRARDLMHRRRIDDL